MKKPRGICPVCKRDVALRENGELRDHQGRSTRLDTPGRPWAFCHGSGSVVSPMPEVMVPGFKDHIDSAERSLQHGNA